MLVLSRKEGEKILIGEDVIITLVKIDHGKVRIGIEAPRTVSVHREELVDFAALGKAVRAAKAGHTVAVEPAEVKKEYVAAVNATN